MHACAARKGKREQGELPIGSNPMRGGAALEGAGISRGWQSKASEAA